MLRYFNVAAPLLASNKERQRSNFLHFSPTFKYFPRRFVFFPLCQTRFGTRKEKERVTVVPNFKQ